MRGSRKFCQSPGWTFFFLVDKGRKDPKYHFKRVIIGPPAKHHLNGVSLACRFLTKIECWLDSFVIFQGIRTITAKKPYIFVIFQGAPDPMPPPPTPLKPFEVMYLAVY